MRNQTGGVRMLYRPGDEAMPPGDGAPKGESEAAIKARQALGEFIDAETMRPLYATDHERDETISRALSTMTLPERVLIEIDMRMRAAVLYSADYDPLR